MESLEKNIQAIFSDLEFKYIYRKDDIHLWEKVYSQLEYQSNEYKSSRIDLLNEFNLHGNDQYHDLSLIIFSDTNPIALWPLTISVKDTLGQLSSQGSPLLAPIFKSNCPSKTIKKTLNKCLEFCTKINIDLSNLTWVSKSTFLNKNQIDNWHLLCLSNGSKSNIEYNLFVDLTKDIEQIRSCYRSSYKPLINKAEKLWDVQINGSSTKQSVWKEFRDLHLLVSGRITRSDKSWDLQYAELLKDEAFLVTLRDVSGVMIGGALFTFSLDEGRYDVGAYNRELFDKPLGHIAQHTAIKELKNKGIKLYKIGRRYFESDNPKPNSKEISISYFKEGFATHTFPDYVHENSTN